MKFLVDNQLSPLIAKGLQNAGYDAVHVRDYGMQDVSDDDIFERAMLEDRILVSADTDFGMLLALRTTHKPSVILLRWPALRLPASQLLVIHNNIPIIKNDLEQGAIVVIEPSRIRIRTLPINKKSE
jgi:predicted nuclease of predicted toxin-antitoxin system